jgi:hypothetical protein
MAEEIKRRPGRPSKGKRGTFTFRVTGFLRGHLEAAADASGRSVSEEIEHRLEQTYLLDRVMGDPLSGEFVRQVITCLDMARTDRGEAWHTNDRSKHALATALAQLVHPRPREELLKRPGSERLDSPENKGWLMAWCASRPFKLEGLSKAGGREPRRRK